MSAMSPLVLPLDRVNLRYAFAVAVLGDFSAQPGADDLAHLIARDCLAAEREYVGVVMLARVARDFDGVASGSAHAGNFVSSHCGANSRAIDDDADID